MQDLSSKASGSWWSTGQLGGGTSGNSAMTAPGGEPAEALDGSEDAPDVEADGYDGRHTERGARAQAARRWVTVNQGVAGAVNGTTRE